MSDERYILYNYDKIWRYEKKIYTIGDRILPLPIKPMELGYYALALVVLVLIEKIIPLSFIPSLVRYTVLPFALVKILKYKKFDGKNPVKFVLGYIEYSLQKKESYQFFRPIKTELGSKKAKIKWNCSCRSY